MSDFLLAQWQLLTNTSWPLLLSLVGFAIGLLVYQHSARNALLHPLIIGTPFIYAVLSIVDLDFQAYYQGNGLLSWLLGPATVALAVPLSQQLRQLPRLFKPLSVALLLGGFFATLSALLLAKAFSLSDIAILSLAAKSVTTPIAIILTEQVGGLNSLVTVVVLLTGIVGVVVANAIFRYTKITDERWQGLILGVTAHAIGTASAFDISPRCGAFATLGMGLNGIWTSAFIVLLVSFFFP